MICTNKGSKPTGGYDDWAEGLILMSDWIPLYRAWN